MVDQTEITNPKIATLEPQWASFRGFSLLFDNPGSCLSPFDEKLLRVNCDVHQTPQLTMYASISNAVSEICSQFPVQQSTFCPLPPFSYHVTAWDGLNEGNIRQIPQPWQHPLADWLQRLPESFLQKSLFTDAAEKSPLVDLVDCQVCFEFGQLFNFEDIAVVARLQPADSDSARQLDRILQYRSELSNIYSREFQIKFSPGFAPHVTLGYFASRKAASAIAAEMPAWAEIVRSHAAGKSITFGSIGLYGFTDMVTFFKRRSGD